MVSNARVATPNRGDFFCLDVDRASGACRRSLNEGLAYLVMASGTQADNRTTSWAATAVAKYAGIGVEKAGAAISRLIAAGDLERRPESTRLKPRYSFAELGPRIAWLPRSIIEGASRTHMPLIQRLRQLGDGFDVGFMIELYGLQNLAADGGLPRSFAYTKFEQKMISSVGAHDVWVFGGASTPKPQRPEPPSPLMHYTTPVGDHNLERNLGYRLVRLEDIGAIEWTPYLFESAHPDSEPILPVEIGDQGGLARFATWFAQELALAMLGGPSAERLMSIGETHGLSVACPLQRHRGNVVMQSVVRLTHRARTANAARFVARDWSLVEAFVEDAVGMLSEDALSVWRGKLQTLRTDTFG